MPRIGRLHIAGGCYHVMGRGLERRRVLGSDEDKADFIERLSAGLEQVGIQCLAWALMSNHYHLAIRVGSYPMSELMRRLLGGFGAAYNRRRGRVGYVFQNRYKSILCDEDRYLLALVRYIHLNPVKARIVADLKALDSYRWTGHSALMGRRTHSWQHTAPVLAQFANTTAEARRQYRQFIGSGLTTNTSTDFDGGGLIRSYGGWENLIQARKAHEQHVGDERILGDTAFVERMLKQDLLPIKEDSQLQRKGWDLNRLVERVCQHFKIDPALITQRGRKNALSTAKAVICYLRVKILKISSYQIGERLHIGQPAVSMAIPRGHRHCREYGLGISDIK